MVTFLAFTFIAFMCGVASTITLFIDPDIGAGLMLGTSIVFLGVIALSHFEDRR